MSAVIKRIAALRSQSVDSAIAFCKEVQALCKGATPRYEAIEQCLRSNPALKHDAKAIAERVIIVPRTRRTRPPRMAKSRIDVFDFKHPTDRHGREWLYGDWTTD